MFNQLFDLSKTRISNCYFLNTSELTFTENIGTFILETIKELPQDEFYQKENNVWISLKSKVHESAIIEGPCIIDHDAEIRCNAFIRGNVMVGKQCVVGNSTELKNCILFDQAKVPHFNYVGDSILGFGAHLGAGAIISNFKADGSNINLTKKDGSKITTNCKKLGAFVGDRVEIGCNSVINPGTIIEKNATIYPLSNIRGYLEENTIYKSEKCIKKY